MGDLVVIFYCCSGGVMMGDVIVVFFGYVKGVEIGIVIDGVIVGVFYIYWCVGIVVYQ